MTSTGSGAPRAAPTFEEGLQILCEELALAVKWQRPCVLLAVYSSEQVRADADAALANHLVGLGQKCIHLSVKRRDPKDMLPFFVEFKDPERTVFVIDGYRWGTSDEADGYAAASLQAEFIMERQIRAVFWLTQKEMLELAHAMPDFWADRIRVIEFVESSKDEQIVEGALDPIWQGTRGHAGKDEDMDAKITMHESVLTELPEGEATDAARGNLLLTLGILNWRKGDFERADEQLQEALRVASRMHDNKFEAACFNAVALVKGSTEKIDEAIDAYKQAIQLAPDQIFVWNNLGGLYAKVGRQDEAMIAFRKGLDARPRDPIAWNGLANVQLKLGYVENAIEAYRKSIQYAPTYAPPWCGLAEVHANMGRIEEAIDCYQKAIELDKRSVAPWIGLGVVFTEQERYREALKAYRKALSLDSRNSSVWNEMGTIHAKLESYDEAASAYSKAIELDRGNGWAHSNLAFAYMQRGKHKESVSLLLRSIELMGIDRDKAVSWNRLASAYRALNDYDNAVAAYQMADRLAPGNATSDVEEASPAPAVDAVRLVRAVESAPSAVALNRESKAGAPAWIFESSDGLRGSGPGDEMAADAASKSGSSTHQEQTPSGSPAQGLVGGVAEQPVHQGEAAEWTAKGNAFFSQGALEQAIAAYNAAIQIDPSGGMPYSNLALTYLTQGQWPEAILLYQKSIELLESDRDKALSWNGLGNAYRCMDDYANAVAAYQRAAELDPETSGIRDRADNFQSNPAPRDAKALNDLGELLLQTGATDKAVAAFQKAIELEPKSGRAHSNLARALAGRGSFGEAVPLYEKAISLLSDDKAKADAWNGLGNAHRKLNDYNKAIHAYQKALALADEGQDLLTRTRFSLLSNVYVNQ